jgi:hypothetical protein
MYQTMERYSGAAFHIYIFDYDHDGFIDIVLPNQIANELTWLRNPGTSYLHKLDTIAS